MKNAAYVIEPTGSRDFGPCKCCGNMSRTVWGMLRKGDIDKAVYFVQWTMSSPQHGANFDLVIGRWGDGSDIADRTSVSLLYRADVDEPGFMIIDAAGRPASDGSLAVKALSRDELVNSTLKAPVFAMVDAIFLQDERLAEICEW
jgi:hypothetical protein